MTIAQMEERHLPGLAMLEKECFSTPWSEAALREELGKGIFLVAENGGEILGYAGCQTVLDEGYITNVAVTRKARKKGVGRALILRMLEIASERKLSFVTLEVRKSNAPAIALYKGLGFSKVGVRKNFYSNPREDAELWKIVMRDAPEL